MKMRPFYRLLLAAALVGTCTTSLATCASADTSAADTAAPIVTTDTTAETTAVIEAPVVNSGETEESDIDVSNRLETYFTSGNGGWTTDDKYDTVKDGVLHITSGSATRTVTHKVELSNAYDIEFRIKVDKRDDELGFKYEHNGQRIMMYIYPNNVVLNSTDGSRSITADNTQWNVYKFSVNGNQADVYLNGVYQLSYNLQTWTAKGGLTFFAKQAAISVDYLKYKHHDATLAITSPAVGSIFAEGGNVKIQSSCEGAASNVPQVDYYANGTYIGTATAAEGYALQWNNLRAGTYVLQAKYGDYVSGTYVLEVAAKVGTIEVKPGATDIKLGETVELALRRNPVGMAGIQYYVNGVETGENYVPKTVGKHVVTAKVTLSDGSYVYAKEAAINVTANTTAGIVLQSNYNVEYTAAAGAAISASDGLFALDVSHTASGITYTTADGKETYSTGLGVYRLQADGGVCDVYYNDQFAFSFIMPTTNKANGIAASGVSGLEISGINATRYTHTKTDGSAVALADITQDYATEFVVNGKQNFTLVLTDGVYETNLTAENGQLIANTYPNGTRGIVERVALFDMPNGKHVWRMTVSNGIAQIFIDNEWAASLRLPVVYSVPYITTTGLGNVYIRETNDAYIFSDSFDDAGELPSSSYWNYHEGVIGNISDGMMTLSPNPDFKLNPDASLNDDFSEKKSIWNGGSFNIADGVMTLNDEKGANTAAKTTSANVTGAADYEIEARIRVTSASKETGWKFEYNTHRFLFYLRSDHIQVNAVKANVNTAEWHTYKLAVKDGGNAEVFIDGTSVGTTTLPSYSRGTPLIAFFVWANDSSNATMEVDYVKYSPVVKDADAEPTIREAYPALLKVYALNPTVSTTIKVDSASEGGVYIAARYDNIYKNLLAGYNFKEGKWEIIRTTAAKSSSIASLTEAFPFGKEVKMELVLNGNAAALYVNGERMITSSLATPDYYGNVGIAVGTDNVKVLDFDYTGTGRPLANALSFINTASSPDIFEYEEGHIYCIQSSNNIFESTDDGYTWTKATLGKYSNNTIRLKSGTIVYTARQSMGGGNYLDNAYVSTDNGATFEGPFPIQSYLRNRITMNNKLTEGSDGRLYFASGESGDGVEGEGGIRVFYSDDEGRTWTAANMLALDGVTIISGDDEARMDAENTGVNCQESRVVEMPDGTLRLYVRTDEGFLYYSVSTDRGATWTAEMWPSEFISVLSAFNIEREAETGYYYMAWEYNNKNDHRTFQRPRTRVALAVSYDNMETWEYIGDIHETSAVSSEFTHMNIGLKVTTNAIYVTTVYYPTGSDGSTSTKNYMVRIDKDTVKTTERFSKVHALKVTAPDALSEAPILETMLVASANGADVYASGKLYSVANPRSGYIPASIVAAYVGANCSENGNSAVITLAKRSITLTAGSTTAVIDGSNVTVSAAPVKGADGLYIPATLLSELFGRNVTIASNGAVVALNTSIGVTDKLSAESVSTYLPAASMGVNGSENGTPSTWAVPEVAAAINAGIVPDTLKSNFRTSITREEFCTLIMSMLNKKYGTVGSAVLVEKLGYKFANNFTDTDNFDVVAANIIGIVNGRGNGIFDPDSGITRQEAAVMLANAAKLLEIKGGEALSFTDMSSAASWAANSITTVTSIVSESGTRVMNGIGNDQFGPLGTYTIEQSILTVYRLFMSK